MADYKARSGISQVGEVTIKAETFWLELGHLRALVAAADQVGLSDNIALRLSGIEKSYTYVGEFTAKAAHLSGVPTGAGRGSSLDGQEKR